MKQVFKKLLVVMAMFPLMFPTTAQAATLEEIQEKGEIVLGLNAEFPPFEWVELVDGKQEIIGFDVALGKLIADEIGVELVIDNRAFDALIATLNTNKIDMIISGMSRTEERAKHVDFSETYFDFVNMFAVRNEDLDLYQKPEDFNGKKVGVLLSSVQETFAKEHYPEFDLVAVANNGDLLEMLKAKKLDAVLMSDLTLKQYMVNYGDVISIVEGIELDDEKAEGSAVAVKKGNEELLAVIDQVIVEAKESGKLEELLDEYIQRASREE